ncbi:YbaY family lipoprotein [Pseudomonas syringae group genomosp. 3]|uniref:YbaY family lipoprotein n=1 Tax=Pseudomonas syringae group genomosp. 3 TaxID=251701 RepID=UPI00218005E5|nr:YbaY family lipoprotein [Pseudomonas syringae group genomosp. 3]
MSSESPVRLQGEVYYLPRIALPTGCELTVTLSDISLADVPAIEIDTCKKTVTHQVPLPFYLVSSPQALIGAFCPWVSSACHDFPDTLACVPRHYRLGSGLKPTFTRTLSCLVFRLPSLPCAPAFCCRPMFSRCR